MKQQRPLRTHKQRMDSALVAFMNLKKKIHRAIRLSPERDRTQDIFTRRLASFSREVFP